MRMSSKLSKRLVIQSERSLVGWLTVGRMTVREVVGKVEFLNEPSGACLDRLRLVGFGRNKSRGPLGQDLREDVGQDAAGAVVVFFHRGIDADNDGDIKGGSVRGMNAEIGDLHRLEVVVDAG